MQKQISTEMKWLFEESGITDSWRASNELLDD